MADIIKETATVPPSAEKEAEAKVAFSPLIVVDLGRQRVGIDDETFFIRTVSGGVQKEAARLTANLGKADHLAVVEGPSGEHKSGVVYDVNGEIRSKFAVQIENARLDLQWRGLQPSDAITLARKMLGGETLEKAVAGGSLVRVEEISDVQAPDAPDVIFVRTSGSGYRERPNAKYLVMLQRSQRSIGPGDQEGQGGKENYWRWFVFTMEGDQLAIAPGFESLVAGVEVGICPAKMQEPEHPTVIWKLDSQIEGKLATHPEPPENGKFNVLYLKSRDWSHRTSPGFVTAGQVTGIYVPGNTGPPETPAR